MSLEVRSSARPALVVLLLVLAVPVRPAQAAGQQAGDPTARMIAELGLREAAEPVSARPGWRKPARVVVRNLPADRKAWLQEAAPGVELVGADTIAEGRAAAATADAVLGFCEDAVVAPSARVKWVQTYNAGIERCLTSGVFRDRGILLTNMQRIAGPVMAEHVMAMLLAYSRGLPGYFMAQRDGRWARGAGPAAWTPFNALSDGDQSAFSLVGKTMLIVGYGGVGSEVARRAHAFGMRIIAIRNSRADLPPLVEKMGLPADLPAYVAEADVVVDTLPLTGDTAGMFDAAVFRAMKKTAFFINVGRGGTVVTDDLVAALREGRIGGAGLDVVEPEPLPSGHALWNAPRLILTPHVSADSDLDEEARWLLVRENLRRYVSGGKMLSVVDTSRGY